MKRCAQFFLALLSVVVLSSPVKAQVGTWFELPVPSMAGHIYDMDMLNTTYGIAGGRVNGILAGVIYTIDGGFNWIHVPVFGFTNLPSYAVWHAVTMLDENTMIIAGDSALCYRSTDQGFSWNQVTISNKGLATVHDIYFKDAREGVMVGGNSYWTVMPPDIAQPTFIAHTWDGGLTWTDESPAIGSWASQPALLSVHYANGVWAACGEFGTVAIYNSGAWVRQPNPSIYPYELYNDITVVDANTMMLSGYLQNVPLQPRMYRTTNGGSRWVNAGPVAYPGGVLNFASNTFFSGSHGWIGASPSYIASTTNGGLNWKTFNTIGASATSPMTTMKFLDSLNGYAAGGDSSANTGWIIRYTGQPLKPNISTSMTSAVFKDVTCEKYTDTVVVIRNNGTGDLVINNGDITLTPAEFSLVGATYPIRLQPGRAVRLTVRWTPSRTSAGPTSGTMTVYSNDPDDNPWNVALTGTRHYGVIDLPTAIDVQPGTCLRDSVTYSVQAGIIGTRNPKLIGFDFVSGHNEFKLITPAIGTVLTGSTTFTFRCYPTQQGTRTGVYRLISGNPACPDTMFTTITGLGEVTRLQAHITDIDFGITCINTVRDTVIRLRNVGNTFLIVDRSELRSGTDVFPMPNLVPQYIPQDSVRNVTMQFTPTRTGIFTAEYRVISGPCRDTIILRARGEAISTEISFFPPGAVTVGPTIIGKQVSRTVTIRNSGKTNATVTKVALENLFPDLALMAVPPLPITLLPTGSFEVTLQFNPLQLGTRETKLVVAWNSVCRDTAKLDVFAPCLPNPYIDPPTAVDMGTQACPQPVRKIVWIKNRGNGPLYFNSATFTGNNPTHFTLISPQVGDSARARDSVRLIIDFNRPTPGSSSASLQLTHNDYDRMPTTIPLTGLRTTSEYTVVGDSTTDFFTRLFLPQRRTYRINSIGDKPVTISEITVERFASVYSVEPSRTLPAPLNPGESMTFDVIFTPNARGPFAGQVRINSKPCNVTHLLGVFGRGDTDGLNVDRGLLEYNVDPCAFLPNCDTLRLSNQGRADVSVLSMTLTQGRPVFSIDPSVTVPFTVAAGQEKSIVICADPSFRGSNTALLELISNDPSYPSLKVTLSARRDSTNIDISMPVVDFGRMLRCSSGFTREVVIANTGEVPEIVSTMLSGFSGGYSVTGGGPDITLQPNRNFKVTVSFDRPSFGVFTDTLWVMTKRCDRKIAVPITGEWVDQRYALAPTPVTFPSVNIGSSAVRPLTLQNNGGFDATISSITITPSGTFTVQPGYPNTVAAGASGGIQLRFTPTAEGPLAATACIILSAPCRDTICVSLEGTGVRGRLVLSSATLDFGNRAQCEQPTFTDTLFNKGTGPVTLISSSITGPGSSAYTNLAPITSQEVLAPGGMRLFPIRHTAANAAGDGPVSATLSIVTDDPVQQLVDIPLDAVRQTLIPAPGASVSYGIIEIAKPTQQVVTLRNTGSARLCYTSARVPATVTYTPALPFCIEPGQSMDVTLTVTPTVTGTWSGTFTLLTSVPCVDSTELRLDARAQQGVIDVAANVDLGSAAACLTRTFDVTISSRYIVDITLDSLRITGPDAAFFTIVSPTNFPRTLTAGGSLIVSLSFLGQNANRNYAATLSASFTAIGLPVVTTTQLSARSLVPFVTVTPVAFGTAFIGQPAVQGNSTITNTSSLPVRIDAVVPSDPAYTVTSTTPPLPVLLQPGETVTVRLNFAPTREGVHSDSLRVQSTQPCPFTATAVLGGNAMRQPIVQARLSVGDISGKPDDHILIPILVDKDLAGAQVASWNGSISFNKSMLFPLRLVNIGTRSSNMNVAMSYVQDSGKVVISASGGIVADGLAPLIYVECLVLLGDALQTPVDMSADFDFNSGYVNVLGRTGGTFTLEGYCYMNGRLIEDRGVGTLKQNRPNPLSLSSGAGTSIEFTVTSDEYAEIALFDAAGRKLRVLYSGHTTQGTHELRVDLNDVQPGVYFYTLTSGSVTATRAMVITR
ncbi:MAG: choice-of-anchor D domain-containing protein [Ignavibacteriae bacterium]|nr:choice-of-anchor D domain-containing protein [Ignavibacteriota bacterium]